MFLALDTCLWFNLIAQLVGPFDSNAEFMAEDFKILETYEITQRVGRIMHAFDGVLAGEDALDV